MKIKNKTKNSIMKELNKLSKELEFLDIGDMRIRVAYVLKVTEDALSDSESWVDEKVSEVVESDHTLLLVGSFVALTFAVGVAIGVLI